jgi:hypothetical protein
MEIDYHVFGRRTTNPESLQATFVRYKPRLNLSTSAIIQVELIIRLEEISIPVQSAAA